MRLATKTMAMIAEALERDQGAKWRSFLAQTIPNQADVYNPVEEKFRSHLGASLIGRKCDRELWLSWHWTTEKKVEGRIARLFNRGHLEEPRFVALLLMIGFEFWAFDANGKQFRITGHKGHFGGSMDGVLRGCLDLPPGEAALAEFKTHNDKSFKLLVKDGVRVAKWEHFVQMQVYMGENGLRYALYCAVNKNDDDIHIEIVEFDQMVYDRYTHRSITIIESRDPPPRIPGAGPGWHECKFCDHRPVCVGRAEPARNCRTCQWSAPVDDGKWVCGNPKVIEVLKEQGYHDDTFELTKDAQLKSCENYQVRQEIKAR